MYIGRDKDGSLWAFKEKPMKNTIDDVWEPRSLDYCRIYDWMISNINIQSNELTPTEIELILKK